MNLLQLLYADLWEAMKKLSEAERRVVLHHALMMTYDRLPDNEQRDTINNNDAERVDAAEAMKLLSVGRTVLSRLTVTGQLSYVKLGRKKMYDRSSIDALIKQGRRAMK